MGSGNGIEVSVDRGLTWVHRDRGFPTTLVGTIPSPRAIVHDPRRLGVVYAGFDSGVYKSVDNGEQWEDLTRTFVGPGGSPERPSIDVIALDPADADRIYAGTFNRGLLITEDGGQSWRRVLSSNIGAIAVEHMPPFHVYAANAGGIQVSRDRGRTWAPVADGPRLRGVSRVAVHPLDAARLYAASSTFGAAPYVMRRQKSEVVSGYSQSLASYLMNGSVRDVAVTLDGRTVLALEVSSRTDDLVVVTINR